MTFTIEDALKSLVPGCEFITVDYEITYWDETKGTQPTKEEIDAEIARLTAQEPWNELRRQRDELLAATDFYALSDQTLTDEMKAYRQALRDLPANTVNPAEVAFPTQPGGVS